MNEENYYHDDSINLYYQKLLKINELREVQKIHQKSIFFIPEKNKKNSSDTTLKSYLREVERKIPKFEDYEVKISLGDNNIQNQGSTRIFSSSLRFEEIKKVMKNSFGIDKKNMHRKFPSAGGLFPIYVVLIQLKDISSLKRGAYYYGGIENTLLKITDLSEKINSQKIEDSLSPMDSPFSDTVIIYIADVEKELFKYKSAGYRHICIETGMMAQELRNSLLLVQNSGDISMSGFRHNLLCKFLNIPVNQYIIPMIQYIGKKS